MDNLHLVTGFLGREHITAADQGAFNAALIGTGQFVLDKGKVFEAQVISNNLIRVFDGELMMQGRFVRLAPNDYADLAIENGEKGMKRNDLIAVRYAKDTLSGIESVNLVVIKGEAVADNPVDPAITEGDITNGAAVQHEFPLWRIPLDGLNVGEPVSLFGEPFMDSMRTLPGIRKSVETIHSEVDAQLAEFVKTQDSYNKGETLSANTAAMFGFDASATPNNIFDFLGKYNLHCWKKRFYGAHYAAEAVETPTAYTIFITTSKQHNFYYADSITVSQTDGKISLNNPSVFSFYDIASNGLSNAVKGKYFSNSDGKYTNLSEVYKFGNNLTQSTKGGEGGQYYTFNGDIQRLVGTFVEETSDWECVFSQDSNAYPKDVVVDGIEYLYCGIPFDNAVNALKFEIGSYTGTGTYGANNPCVLTLDKPPKLIWLATQEDKTNGYQTTPTNSSFSSVIDCSNLTTEYKRGYGFFSTNHTKSYGKKSADGRTIYWYYTDSASAQFNGTGMKYTIIVFF